MRCGKGKGLEEVRRHVRAGMSVKDAVKYVAENEGLEAGALLNRSNRSEPSY